MEGVEPAHHCNMARLVQAEDLFDNLILPVVGKIQIDVGEFFQCHAVAVQKPLEIQLEAHRADIADSETKADQRVGGAAARDPLDTVAATVLEQVPNGQKIFLIAHFGDHLQLGVELRPVAHGLRPVALRKSSHGEAGQKLAGRAGLGRIKAGEGELAEFKCEATFPGDPFIISLSSRSEDAPAGFAGVRFIQQSESADAFYNAEVQEVLPVFATDERGVARGCDEAVAVLHPEVAGYFRLREQTAEVLVSGSVFCIESTRTVVHAEFRADDWFETRSLGRLEKWHGGMEVRIADSHSLAACLCGDLDDPLGREQGFHETVAGAKMQDGCRRLHGSSDRNLRWFFRITLGALVLAQPEVMPAQDGSAAVAGSDFIHRLGCPVERGRILCRGNEWQLREECAFVEIREFQRNKTEADAALPSLFQQRGDEAVGRRLQVGGFIQAAAAQALLEIIVSHPH